MACAAVTAYDPKFYDQVPDIVEAEKELPLHETLIPALAKTLVKHKIHEDFGIILLHTHFGLAPSERMVEVIKNGVSVTKPTAQSSDQIPRVFALSPASDTLQPVEFTSTDSDGSAALAERVKKLTPAFVKDFATVLRKAGASHMFGVSPVIHKEELIPDDSSMVLVETQEHETRSLVMKSFLRETVDFDNLVCTMWGSDGKVHGTCVQLAYCQAVGQSGHLRLFAHKHV